jgi:alpha-L-fucosidase
VIQNKADSAHLGLICRGLLVFALIGGLEAQDAAPTNENIRLPSSDFHGQRTKDYVEADPLPEYQHASPAAFEAFRDMKYGVRIHWGIYSILGQPHESWPFLNLSYEQKQAYEELYKSWNPTGFNADEWMKLFADNGLKMFAFTAKHHEGFSMFDTQTRVKQRVNWTASGGPKLEDCDLAYSIMDTPFHRDVVKELCNAAHNHGIKIDLYFSNPDWYDADFRPYGWSPITTPTALAHPELYGKASIAERKGTPYATVADETPDEQARMMQRYRQQLTELLSNYGKIDMICLDNWLGKTVWPETRDTLMALRKIQPDVMFRARGIGNYGDYYTPEGFVPGGKENTDMPWFVIDPLAKSFSYDANPKDYKGGGWIVKMLIDTVAKGGNFMVGIGPDSNGKFAPMAVENLQEAGAWLKVNGEGIYATRPREGEFWKEGDTIRFTQTKDHRTIYVFSLQWPGAKLSLKSVQPQAGSQIFLLGDSTPLPWSYTAKAGTVIQMPPELQDETKRPCKFAYAFKILK